MAVVPHAMVPYGTINNKVRTDGWAISTDKGGGLLAWDPSEEQADPDSFRAKAYGMLSMLC